MFDTVLTTEISLQTIYASVVCKYHRTQIVARNVEHTQTRYVYIKNINKLQNIQKLQKKNNYRKVRTVYSRYCKKKIFRTF